MIGIFAKKRVEGNKIRQTGFEFLQKARSQEPYSNDRKSKDKPRPRAPHSALRILLVDDDPSFGKIMIRSAALRGINLTFCVALDQVAQYSHEKFDLALIDFNLGAVTGVEFSEYLTRYKFGALDTIIISHDEKTVASDWPSNARRFLNKKIGPHMIFDSVMRSYRPDDLFQQEKDKA